MKQNEKPVALVEKKHLSLLKQTIFADDSAGFNTICEAIFIQLMTRFFGDNCLELAASNTLEDDWFYQGKTAFHLILSNKTEQLIIYLHPNWVLEQLPQRSQIAKSLQKIENAIASETVFLSVQLTPQRICLETVSSLRAGMVIQTDHALCKPLLLRHEKKTISQVDLGQFHHHKSIRLRSTS